MTQTINAVDWRKQLRTNQRKTVIVIGLFVVIYIFVGLLIDLYINPAFRQMSFYDSLVALVSFQVIPKAAIIMGIVAAVSIAITFAFHDRIMLLGTNYHEITQSKMRNLAEKQLYNVVSEMRIASGLRYMPRVFLIEAEYMNAFASGYSEKSALVAVTQGLLEKLERDELQAVVAHEMSHIRHNDIKLTLVASVLSNLMLIAIDFLFYNMLFSGDRRRRNNDEGGNRLFLIVILLRYLLPLITLVLLLYLSRTREYMADAGAVELTRNNSPLANALLKISGDHTENKDYYSNAYRQTSHEEVRQAAYIFDPVQAGIHFQSSVASLFSTHPSLKDRLKALGFRSNS